MVKLFGVDKAKEDFVALTEMCREMERTKIFCGSQRDGRTSAHALRQRADPRVRVQAHRSFVLMKLALLNSFQFLSDVAR